MESKTKTVMACKKKVAEGILIREMTKEEREILNKAYMTYAEQVIDDLNDYAAEHPKRWRNIPLKSALTTESNEKFGEYWDLVKDGFGDGWKPVVVTKAVFVDLE